MITIIIPSLKKNLFARQLSKSQCQIWNHLPEVISLKTLTRRDGMSTKQQTNESQQHARFIWTDWELWTIMVAVDFAFSQRPKSFTLVSKCGVQWWLWSFQVITIQIHANITAYCYNQNRPKHSSLMNMFKVVLYGSSRQVHFISLQQRDRTKRFGPYPSLYVPSLL